VRKSPKRENGKVRIKPETYTGKVSTGSHLGDTANRGSVSNLSDFLGFLLRLLEEVLLAVLEPAIVGAGARHVVGRLDEQLQHWISTFLISFYCRGHD